MNTDTYYAVAPWAWFVFGFIGSVGLTSGIRAVYNWGMTNTRFAVTYYVLDADGNALTYHRVASVDTDDRIKLGRIMASWHGVPAARIEIEDVSTNTLPLNTR